MSRSKNTTIELPSYNCYCDYSSGNYGMHSLMFTDARGNRFWFSYKTLIAFDGPTGGRTVLKNYWSTTTGKHLNCIDGGDKKNRVNQETFNKKFETVFGQKVPT